MGEASHRHHDALRLAVVGGERVQGEGDKEGRGRCAAYAIESRRYQRREDR
jgi:hypothetical protein